MSRKGFGGKARIAVSGLACLLAMVLVLGSSRACLASDYLVGLFGVPHGDWSILREAGLNAAMLREDEVASVRNLPIKKIYVLGVNPSRIKEGLQEQGLGRRMQGFRALNDAYSFYLAGDMSCRHKDLIDSLKKRLNINQRVMLCVVKGREAGCFPDYDVLFYHYPLMRRQTSLADMLRDQVATLKQSGFDDYLFVQTHQQFWYKDVIESLHAHRDSYLYPDGQVVRMLIYYALATGCKGYFLYDAEAMGGEHSQERMLGAAQAIIETRALYPTLARVRGVEFFQKGGDIYGTIMQTPDFDLVFAFSGDPKTIYHPSTQPLKVDLREVIGTNRYLSIYRYSPLGCVAVGDKLDLPQDHALILVGLKNRGGLDFLKLDANGLKTYVRILEARTDRLALNLKARGLSPGSELTQPSANLAEKAAALLAYLDRMNALKRDVWWKTAGRMPIDGDLLNDVLWGKKTGRQAKPSKEDCFNFYFH